MRLQLAVGGLALILVSCATQQIPPISEDWMLSSVQDGNTIWVKKNDESPRQVRLACINAPGLQQSDGIESRNYLQSLLPKNSEMAMTFMGKERGQYIAEIFVPKQPKHGEEETFVNYEMVRAGQAYVYPKDKQKCPNFDVLPKGEEQAKNEKLGVWGR
jgi:micrococcal nuclease